MASKIIIKNKSMIENPYIITSLFKRFLTLINIKLKSEALGLWYGKISTTFVTGMKIQWRVSTFTSKMRCFCVHIPKPNSCVSWTTCQISKKDLKICIKKKRNKTKQKEFLSFLSIRELKTHHLLKFPHRIC